MFEIFKYDFLYRVKQPMIYIFSAVFLILTLLSLLFDQVNIGSILIDNIHINAPFAIMSQVGFMSLFCLLVATALNNSAALRDFSNQFNEILFATPIKKSSYLFGRFFSSLLLSAFPMLAVLLAFAIVSVIGNSDKVGPVYLGAYWQSLVVFILPNALIFSSILFSLAVLSRSRIVAFVGALILFYGYLNFTVSIITTEGGDWLWLGDPFGLALFTDLTRYWTVADKETQWITLGGPMLWNRLVWMFFGLTVFGITYARFSFQAKRKRSKKRVQSTSEGSGFLLPSEADLPLTTARSGWGAAFTQFIFQVMTDLRSILRSNAFRILVGFALMLLIPNLMQADKLLGTGNHPVTYLMISAIRSSMPLFIVIIIGFYSGDMVWKERTAKMNQLVDATPISTWMPISSKFLSLFLAIGLVLLASVLCGVAVQLALGFDRIDMVQYLMELMVIDWSRYLAVIALALFIHLLVNNLYLGFFLFMVLVLVNTFLWGALSITSNLIIFSGVPEYTFSDMTRWVPFQQGITGFVIYWTTAGLLLLAINALFAHRGVGLNWKDRWSIAKLRFDKKAKTVVLVIFLLWLGIGSHLYYQTNVINSTLSRSDQMELAVAYEQTYKQYENIPQPKIVTADYEVSLFPEERAFNAAVDWVLVNKEEYPIDQVHFALPDIFHVTLDVPGAELVEDDRELGYQIFTLASALQVGDSLTVRVESTYQAMGIENQLELPNFTQNGIFLNNGSFLPVIGYATYREVRDEEDRKKFGLPARESETTLSRNCNSCEDNFLTQDADWVKASFKISTSEDQIAIAPGKLTGSWKEDGRSYYTYELNKPVINFYAFLSARYQVRREQWNGVDLEVYYHDTHDYNVDKMISSMRTSLAHYSTIYGPYPHQQARIIEFPRFAKFAQAFPGTMPYSESLGFIADLKDKTDIDMVTYAVAHEMGHQWWAHQVIGGATSGASMLSETLAQHSALQIMEKLYGKDQIRKFLKFEMEKYLSSRGEAKEPERPLNEVLKSQGYIFYNKGSSAMFALREYVGVDKVNRALRSFYEKTAYSEGSYPTTLDLMDEFRHVTPDSLSYLLEDYFETITLYDNAIYQASYQQLEDGNYELLVSFQVEKLRADSIGQEHSVQANDWVEVAIYGDELEEEVLYNGFHRFRSGDNKLQFIVDREPKNIKIDPRFLLVDRFLDDNEYEISE